MQTITWTIAGSDSGAGAGIQADLQTIQALGAYGCSVITAVTAQNSLTINDIYYLPTTSISQQIETLAADLMPSAIKLGLLGKPDILQVVLDFLKTFNGHVVCDPLLRATCGESLFVRFNTTEKKMSAWGANPMQQYLQHLRELFPYIDLLTPNLGEAEHMLGRPLRTSADVEQATQELLAWGVKSVLIKGGHAADPLFAQDYWSNGKEAFWLCSERCLPQNFHGTGCSLASAITTCLGLGYDIKDAIVIGKMYVRQGLRLAKPIGQGLIPLAHQAWPETMQDLPYLTPQALSNEPEVFPSCGDTPLGLYPIVDSAAWLEKLLPLGVSTIQLRIKNKTGYELEKEIQQAIAIARPYSARLFINDYWELALRYGAYGVHLGQEDLLTATVKDIYQAGLRLGISTHCYYEVARAHAYRPSYLAIGPIYPTTSKIMPFAPQGIDQLQRWRRTLQYPLVAIGGVNLERMPEMIASQVEGVAMISAITKAHDPKAVTQQFLALMMKE